MASGEQHNVELWIENVDPLLPVPVPELVVAGETMDRKRGPTCGVSE
jgi:hypothetical protein